MTTRISMLAIDLAKGSFQVCAIGADGAVQYNRVLSRPRLMTLLSEQPACVVAMEACSYLASLGPCGAVPRPRGALGAGGVCKAVCQTAEKRQG